MPHRPIAGERYATGGDRRVRHRKRARLDAWQRCCSRRTFRSDWQQNRPTRRWTARDECPRPGCCCGLLLLPEEQHPARQCRPLRRFQTWAVRYCLERTGWCLRSGWSGGGHGSRREHCWLPTWPNHPYRPRHWIGWWTLFDRPRWCPSHGTRRHRRWAGSGCDRRD